MYTFGYVFGIRESFNRNVYKVNLYRYGVLYRTLSVTKGSSVTLPSVPIVYDDDIAHYGWTKTAGNTTRDYSATAKITPTADMDLYAVYSYNVTEVGTKTLTCSGSSASSSGTSYTNSVVAPLSGTCTISGSSVSKTPSGNYPSTLILGSSTSASDYCQIGSTFVTGTIGYQQTPKTANVTAGQKISLKITNTSTSDTTITHTINVVYPANVTTTLYRSSLGLYTITLYNGDEIYETVEIAQGRTYTFPTCTVTNRNFAGWSLSETNLVANYLAGNTIRPTFDMELYAIFGVESEDIITDGNGYIIAKGAKVTHQSGHSNATGPINNTGYGNYNATLTFTNNTTKTITLGSSSGETSVKLISSVGIKSINKPQGSSTTTDNGYDSTDYEYVIITTNVSYQITITRYIYER